MNNLSKFLFSVRRYFNRWKYTFSPKVEVPFIVDQIYLSFEKSLKRDSDVSSLYYHTWYRVYLNSRDYNYFHQDFREIVRRTTEDMMIKVKSDYRCSSSYVPHSPAWQIRFIEVGDGVTRDEVTGEEIHLDEKTPIKIVPGRYPANIDSNTNTFTINTNGQIKSINLNPYAFKNIEKVGEGNFIAPINIVHSDGAQPVNGDSFTLAIIAGSKFLVNGKRTDKFVMNEQRLFIAGRSSSSKINGISVLKIDNERIVNPHALLINENGILRIEPQPNCHVYQGGNVINGTIDWPQGSLFDFAHETTIKNI